MATIIIELMIVKGGLEKTWYIIIIGPNVGRLFV